MSKSTEETRLRTILDRLEGQRLTGQPRRLPGWAAAAILGAGLSLSACSPPAQEPCEENCNNSDNINNYNNTNNPLYGINNINNANNINNINNMNNLLYGIPDGGTDDLDSDCPNCEYGFPLYGFPDDAGTDAVPLYGKK
ncbi:hypothetical protein KKC22_19170 [Myxococcota bacterium]|nr:hypothetical protein [Myxococcota bacterium]